MRIILANGISTNGEGNIDLLGAELKRRGFTVSDVRLPKRWVISARWAAPHDAKILADVSADGDVLVAHSFGCLRAYHASLLVKYKAIFCIAPAMPAEHQWRQPRKVFCYHSRDDRALKASRLLLAHPFGGGSAGLYGFTQPGVVNVDCRGADHSDYFRGRRLTDLAGHVERICRC